QQDQPQKSSKPANIIVKHDFETNLRKKFGNFPPISEDDSSKFNNNFFNSNWTAYNSSSSTSSSSSRPSHKTHVEIITKNGPTKKSNIIGSNYNPEVVSTSQNNNYHSHHHNNINFNIRNDISDSSFARALYDRKSTCMLYLQADHTFFQKMGSDEASIEAITRHVQRANSIYRNTVIQDMSTVCNLRNFQVLEHALGLITIDHKNKRTRHVFEENDLDIKLHSSYDIDVVSISQYLYSYILDV
uniref:Uncharacterized protein n=1 Tax=Megaselia scalaris TaxID=36166 RepID=T1GWG6_MEGSC